MKRFMPENRHQSVVLATLFHADKRGKDGAMLPSLQIKAILTHNSHYGPEWALFLLRRGKPDRAPVHPADINDGKQDTAGQSCPRKNQDLACEASWRVGSQAV